MTRTEGTSVVKRLAQFNKYNVLQVGSNSISYMRSTGKPRALRCCRGVTNSVATAANFWAFGSVKDNADDFSSFDNDVGESSKLNYQIGGSR